MSLRFPLLASKTWTNVSLLADAINLLSGDNASELMLVRWPVKIRTFLLLIVVCVAGGISFCLTVGGTDFASLCESAYQPPTPPATASPTRPIAKALRVIVFSFPRRAASGLSSNVGGGVADGGVLGLVEPLNWGFCACSRALTNARILEKRF